MSGISVGSCEHLFMDQQFVVIFLFAVVWGGWVSKFCAICNSCNWWGKWKTKKKQLHDMFISEVLLFSLLYSVLYYVLFYFCIHVCFHAAFHSVLKHNTIQYLLLSIMVVAVLQQTTNRIKVTWINYVLIDRLKVFLVCCCLISFYRLFWTWELIEVLVKAILYCAKKIKQ